MNEGRCINLVELSEMKAIIEGLIFVSGNEGITKKEIQKVLDLDKDMAEHVLNELKFDYEVVVEE